MNEKRNIGIKVLGILLATLMVMGGLMVLGNASAEDTTEDETETIEPEFPEIQITEETIKGKMGGGDFIGIYNEDKDAMIGVLYGTEENPNNVYLISIYTRYLGAADVYEDDELIKSDHPIPVRTLFAQRFAGLYEFDDVNDDGMFDSSREYDNGTEIITREAVYKKVNTWTAWERSEVVETEVDEDTKEWSFSLTTKDLRYKGPFGIFNKWNVWDERLEELKLTFHLYMTKGYGTKDDVPVWKVDVTSKGDGNYNVDDVQRQDDRSYSGTTIDAEFKYDSEINGWEFDGNNTNPCLLWTTQILFANAVSDEVAGWVKTLIEKKESGMNPSGELSYETDDGLETVSDEDIEEDSEFGEEADDGIFTNERPKLIRKNKLHCGDDWQKVGMLTWVNEVTVDDVEDEMYFQIYGARSFFVVDWSKGAAAGFLAVGGFSYPGGKKIYHDPTYSSSVFQMAGELGGVEDPEAEKAPSFGIPMMVTGVAAAIVVSVAIAKTSKLRKKD